MPWTVPENIGTHPASPVWETMHEAVIYGGAAPFAPAAPWL